MEVPSESVPGEDNSYLMFGDCVAGLGMDSTGGCGRAEHLYTDHPDRQGERPDIGLEQRSGLFRSSQRRRQASRREAPAFGSNRPRVGNSAEWTPAHQELEAEIRRFDV